MAGKKSFVDVLGVCLVVMLVAIMAASPQQVAHAQQQQPPCTPLSLRDCLNALEGADPDIYCCNEIRALNTECLCALDAEYGGSQSQGTVQRGKQIATYCDPQRRGGFNCA
ncbi:unnamed protein product [Sphagnum jensenii]|jgi:hypothetical protein|uniref:Bifunctional inhibitor/plant lipid transfer protein/seed storage helical domain-containing protein n=1 Tax=Sphagnum jensenii TaxID=128206 RepID=A0ABP0VRE9_9BRYO